MICDYTIDLDRIILKPLIEDDIEALRILRNREKIYFLNNSEISEEQQKRWYDNYLLKDDDIMFSIVPKSDLTKFCGAIALYKIEKAKRLCEIGRTLVDKNILPDKGIGLEATRGACKFAFEILGVERIRTQIIRTNERSMKLHQRAGFYILDDSDTRFCLVEVTKDTLKT